MSKAIRIFKWGVFGAASLLVLLTAAAALLPRVLNTEAIGRNLATELEAHYHIRSERIEISFLPFPRIVMSGVGTTIPETLTASAETVIIRPKILPLLTGQFAPGAIEVLSPTISARLPEQPFESQAKVSPQHLSRLKDRIFQLRSILIAIIPDAVIDVRNGGLQLYRGQNRAFFFEEIDFRSSVHAQRVDFELTSGKSDLWQALSFSGWVDLGTLKSSGELNLTGGNPADLIRYLNMSPSNNIGGSQIGLTVTLSTSGLKSLHADFTASVPQFSIDDAPPGFVLSNGALTGALNIDADGINFSISPFRFDNPRLDLTASYIERYADKSVTLDIASRDTDAATVKNLLLAVNKENPIIRRVFEIIREGEIPEVLFSARASKGSDLTNLENITIKGSIEKGVVFAPKAELLVSNVSGKVLLEGGVLNATHLFGQTTGSSTSEGELRIGLQKENSLFHLDLPITADLSELPAVLSRVVDNHAFRQELEQVKEVTGKAQGRLVLGESLKALDVRVESGPFQLSGRYGRLSEPIDLRGSFFLLEKSKISATALSGKSGISSFERADLSYEWGEAKVLEINSQARCSVSMDLLWPHLRAREYWKNFLDAAPKGLLAFDSFRFIGPLADPSQWVFNAKGSVENVVVQNKRLNGPLTLKTGAFEIDGDQIALERIETVLADSSVSVSGNITGYIDYPKKLDLQLSGQLGPEGNRIAASLAGFPPWLRAISNLTLQSSRLTWDRELKTVFKGEMELSKGPRIKINLVRTPQEISIEDLVIKDEDSDATISMVSRHNQVKIGFSGTLNNKTADRLLIENKLLTGPINGKFNAHLYLDAPEKSSAQGDVKISGFQLPFNLPATARIENAEIKADGNQLNVKSAMISMNGSRLSFTGSIAMTEGAYLLDLNAFADTFDLETILRKTEDQGRKTEEAGSFSSILRPPVKGVIRVRSEHLSYGKVSWDPADADVVLSPESIEVRINQANLCGISTPGTIIITPDGLNVSISLSAKDQDLESALACLFNKRHILTGSYTLTGNLSARGTSDNIADSLEGNVELKAKGGRIFRFDTLGKIISLLSVSEIYRGVLPDILSEGCEYKSIEAKGTIKNGKLVLSDSVVDGPCIKVVLHGEIDLARQKVDAVALVAPLRTVERVVGATPIMGKVLNEALLTLPVRVSGNLDNPDVVLLSPSAVGEQFFGVMKSVFKLPLAIFQPFGGKTSDTDSKR